MSPLALQTDTGNRLVKDHFNRKTFAERLATTIAHRTNQESFVIGLYGAWGEGKTTVLDYMDEELAKSQDVVLIRFNPWMFSSDEALTTALINTIGTEVDAQLKDKKEGAQRIGHLLLNYGGKLAKTAGSLIGNSWVEKGGEFAEGLAEGMNPEEQTLEQLKTRIGEALLTADKRVVVLLDDIDRLTRHEIQQVFRLIKVAADFPTVTYVLAFDPEMVAAAVAAQYGSGNPEDGQRFLEKIVQLPLHLPHVARAAITEYTYDLLVEILSQAGLELSEDQSRRLTEVLSEDIMEAIRTPRQAKRYVNAVAFALPILLGETDPVDVMLVEALRVLYPQTFELVRSQPDLFLNPENSGGLLQRSKDKIKAQLTKTFKGHDHHAVNIVHELFPEVGALQNGVYVARAGDDPRLQGVFRPRYFSRYFEYAISGDDVSDADLSEFMRNAVNRPAEADHLLSSIALEKRAFKFMEGVRETFYVSDTKTRTEVLFALARAIPKFEKNSHFHVLTNPINAVLRLMVDEIQQSAPAEALSLAQEFIKLIPALYALRLMESLDSTTTARSMSREYSEQKEVILNELREHLVVRFETSQAEISSLMFNHYVRILRRVATLRGRQAAEILLVGRLGLGRDEVVRFLAYWSPTTSNGRAFVTGEFTRSSYDRLTDLIDPTTLLQLLDTHYPSKSDHETAKGGVTSDPWLNDTEKVTRDIDEAAHQIASQIRRYHQADQKECLQDAKVGIEKNDAILPQDQEAVTNDSSSE